MKLTIENMDIMIQQLHKRISQGILCAISTDLNVMYLMCWSKYQSNTEEKEPFVKHVFTALLEAVGFREWTPSQS